MSLEKKYRRVEGRDGRTWLMGVGFNDIWVHNPSDERGINGDVKTFPLPGGALIRFKGPWASNPAALKKETGIEV